jgi:hypothetical protein
LSSEPSPTGSASMPSADPDPRVRSGLPGMSVTSLMDASAQACLPPAGASGIWPVHGRRAGPARPAPGGAVVGAGLRSGGAAGRVARNGSTRAAPGHPHQPAAARAVHPPGYARGHRLVTAADARSHRSLEDIAWRPGRGPVPSADRAPPAGQRAARRIRDVCRRDYRLRSAMDLACICDMPRYGTDRQVQVRQQASHLPSPRQPQVGHRPSLVAVSNARTSRERDRRTSFVAESSVHGSAKWSRSTPTVVSTWPRTTPARRAGQALHRVPAEHPGGRRRGRRRPAVTARPRRGLPDRKR